MEITELPKGSRIYYTGDMANQDGFGTITGHDVCQWGQFVDIKMDDGRNIEHLPINSFSNEYKGHGGTRWVTLAAYNAYRQGIADTYGWTCKPAV